MSRIYQVSRLDEAALVMARRSGKRCVRVCDQPIAYIVRSLRRLPRGGRGASRTWYLCAEHAKEFAATHLIEAFVE